jgi:hypothetical protein
MDFLHKETVNPRDHEDHKKQLPSSSMVYASHTLVATTARSARKHFFMLKGSEFSSATA